MVTEEMKQEYLDKIYKEMNRRNIYDEDIPRVIGKTGFMKAFNENPEEQLHYNIASTVDKILVVAAKA